MPLEVRGTTRKKRKVATERPTLPTSESPSLADRLLSAIETKEENVVSRPTVRDLWELTDAGERPNLFRRNFYPFRDISLLGID